MATTPPSNKWSLSIEVPMSLSTKRDLRITALALLTPRIGWPACPVLKNATYHDNDINSTSTQSTTN